MLANICNTQAPQGHIGTRFQVAHLSIRLSAGDQDGTMANHTWEDPKVLKKILQVERSPYS